MYNVNLQNIMLRDMTRHYQDVDREEKDATYKLYKSLKYLEMKQSEFRKLYQEKFR